MQSLLDRAKAQFIYEHEHRLRILKASKGAKRKKAFIDAYRGLAQGIASGTFLNQEFEPEKKAVQKFQLLRRFITPSSVIAEVGPGNYALANIVARHVQFLTLIDITKTAYKDLPRNCRLHISDGTQMPEKLQNFDMIFGMHVLEHIHPKALHEHLVSIRRALVDGGYYILFTPNRLTGPHDISKFFSSSAQGLHLKEYTITEIRQKLLKAKFTKVSCYAGGKGWYLSIPIIFPILLESFLQALPFSLANRFSKLLPIKALLGIILVVKKS